MLKSLTVWITTNCEKFWNRWEYQSTLPASCKTCMQVRHGTMDWFQIGKGLRQGCMLSPCLFNLYPEYILWNARLDKHKLGSILAGEISITSNMRMIHLYSRKQRGTKQPLDEGERGDEKADLKLNIQKLKIMVSSPNTWWQIDGETMETVTDFIFLGSKITPGDDHSHEITRHLLLGRKAMTNLYSILKAEILFCQQRSI